MADAVTYDLVLSDFRRGQNRARIANLANGLPPYSEQEVEENGINVNISDLTHTRLLHDARSQYHNNLLKPGLYARAKTDAGPVHKRAARSAVVTKEWNKVMKGSIPYYESKRASFGNLVLHGISPGVWEDEDSWCPVPLGVEDVLLPGETLLGFKNLPFFVFRRSFTGIELEKLTQREKRDPGWNMPFVKRIMEWLNAQASQLRSLNWPDVWAPEKIAERMKTEAGGTLAGDRAPKIDVFDIYAYDDSGSQEGWVRRIILDSWSEPVFDTAGKVSTTRKEGVMGETDGFLFTSKNRKVARHWREVVKFQFADLSAVFPARYHSVRGLGWMLYSACHLGTRLRCKFYESVLEALMMLFEVESQDDVQNALKLNLVNRGFIDKTIRPVKAADRWQVNAGLVELGLRDNAQVISENSSAWVQNRDFSQDRTQKTRYQVMAELQAATGLVGAAMAHASEYERIEMREIFRRFCKRNSRDPEVRMFRAACLKQDVPEYMLNDPDAWETDIERIMGGGNKTLEMQIADWLMQYRPAFDPEAQREILRRSTLAYTDAATALSLVPENPVQITSSVREAEHIASDLMNGINVEPLAGENQIEVIETLLRILTQKITEGNQQGGMVAPNVLQGLQAIAQHVAQRIGIIAEDPAEKPRVKMYGDLLGKIANHLKAFQQRLQEAMQKQAQGGNGQGGLDPKDAAKIQGTMLMAQTKAQIAERSAAQRTAQRQVQHELKLRQQMEQHKVDIAAKDLESAGTIRRSRLSALED